MIGLGRTGAVLLLAVVACAGAEPPETLAPRGVTPGRRLPWPEVTEPVKDWAFAAGQEEIAIETRGSKGRSSVTVWCIVHDGKLYVATDGNRPKRWVRQIDRDPAARVGIAERAYPVRARAVREQAEWDAVMAAYAKKYGGQLGRYEFPRAGDTSRGRVYELASPR